MYMHTCVGTSYVRTYLRTYRHTDKHTSRHTDIQTGRQTYRHTDRHSSYREADRQIHIQDVYISAHAGARVDPAASRISTHGAGLLADHRLSCLGGCSVSHDDFYFFIRGKNNFRILQDISVFFSCVGSVVGCLWIFGWAAWEKFCPAWNFGGFFPVPTCRTCMTNPTFEWAWRARPMQFKIQKTDVPEAESSWTEWFGESSFSSRSAVLLLTGPVESLGSSSRKHV